MAECELDKTILIVTGASLRAEEMDRALAYRLAEEVKQRLGAESGWRPLVVSDILYLNDKRVSARPVISIGGPGVNSLSALLFRELPATLAIDNTLIIQMDVELKDLRCSLWGMDNPRTVDALDLFVRLGHLDRFIAAAQTRASGTF